MQANIQREMLLSLIESKLRLWCTDIEVVNDIRKIVDMAQRICRGVGKHEHIEAMEVHIEDKVHLPVTHKELATRILQYFDKALPGDSTGPEMTIEEWVDHIFVEDGDLADARLHHTLQREDLEKIVDGWFSMDDSSMTISMVPKIVDGLLAKCHKTT